MNSEKRRSIGFIAWLPVLVTLTLLAVELLDTPWYVATVMHEYPGSQSGDIIIASQRGFVCGFYLRLLLLPLTLALAGTFAAGSKTYRSIGVISIIAAGMQLLLAVLYWYLWYYEGTVSYTLSYNVPGVVLLAALYDDPPKALVLREVLCYFPTIVTLIVAFCAKDGSEKTATAPVAQPVATQPAFTQPVYQTVIRPEPFVPVQEQPQTSAPQPDSPAPEIDMQPVWQPQREPRPRFCAACGTALPEGGRFCPKCGNKCKE